MPPKVKRTKAEHAADFKYVLTELLAIDEDDVDHPIRKALDRAGIVRVGDMIGMDMPDFETLEYVYEEEDKSKKLTVLPKHHIRNLQAFKRWIAFLQIDGLPMIANDWTSLDSDDFEYFKQGPYNSNNAIQELKKQNKPVLPTSSTPSTKISDPVKDFRKSIWRDPSLFLTLKRDSDYCNWLQNTKLQASSQGVENVLDSTYAPSDQEEADLFVEQQKYMISVLSTTLKNTKGQELVRDYAATHDAQKVLEELHKHCTESTQAADECRKIQNFLLTAKAEDWDGNMFSFIAYLKDQAKSHNDKTKVKLTDTQICGYIENAVSSIPDLSGIKKTAELPEKATGKPLPLIQYYELLEQAALDYDIKVSKASNKPYHSKRHVYAHDLSHDSFEAHMDADYDDFYDPGTFDLDTPLYEVQKQFQRSHNRPLLPKDTWYGLQSGDQRCWDNLTDAGKQTIISGLCGPSKAPPKPPPLSQKPPTGMTRHVRFTNASEADVSAFEAFCAGRVSGITEVHQMHQQTATSADDVQEQEEDNDGEAEETNDDELYAFLTRNRNPKKKPSSEPKTASCPLAGNVNRLLSKSMAKK